MSTTEIITSFELQVDDSTDLSTAEELTVLNRVRRKINRRCLEANRKPYTVNQSTTLPYVALPSDFYLFAPNRNTEDGSYYSEVPGIFVGSSNTQITIISYGDRLQYLNSTSHAYLDLINDRLVFTLQPTATNAVTFDYYAQPVDLLAGESDWITKKFPDALIYGMAVEDTIIQQSDKARSYLPENQAKFKEELAEIASWNFNLFKN